VPGSSVGSASLSRRVDPRLPLEARDTIRVARQPGGQHFNRHIPVQACVARAPHLAHTAAAEQIHNLEIAQPGAYAQAMDDSRRSSFQKCAGLLIQQRLHLAEQRRIARARPRQERRARLHRQSLRGKIQLLDPLPPLSLNAQPWG
jgi:hypothetical protein